MATSIYENERGDSSLHLDPDTANISSSTSYNILPKTDNNIIQDVLGVRVHHSVDNIHDALDYIPKKKQEAIFDATGYHKMKSKIISPNPESNF
jgi:hypothetical protein